MAFNYSKLIGRIAEKYGTRRAFAAALGMTDAALSSRLNNQVPFKATEIAKICALLDIADEAIPEYFFTLKVE